MTPVVDIRQAQWLKPPEPESGGTVTAIPGDRLKPGPITRRCSACGRADDSDSELAGTCEYCPGLVPLIAA